jgi:hypothetical protein
MDELYYIIGKLFVENTKLRDGVKQLQDNLGDVQSKYVQLQQEIMSKDADKAFVKREAEVS